MKTVITMSKLEKEATLETIKLFNQDANAAFTDVSDKSYSEKYETDEEGNITMTIDIDDGLFIESLLFIGSISKQIMAVANMVKAFTGSVKKTVKTFKQRTEKYRWNKYEAAIVKYNDGKLNDIMFMYVVEDENGDVQVQVFKDGTISDGAILEVVSSMKGENSKVKAAAFIKNGKLKFI